MLIEHPIEAIIIDDEPNAIANLRKMIAVYCPSINVIDTAQSAEAGSFLVNTHNPDVIFLDVSMPGKSGFELLSMLTCAPAIVFVTAYEQYAINAIKANAIDYLLKPIDIPELKKVEEKLLLLKKLFKENTLLSGYRESVSSLTGLLQTPQPLKTITLFDTNAYRIVNLEEILYMVGDSNYTSFYLTGRDRIVVSRTLKEYEAILIPQGFLRIHKSSIINPRHLKAMDRKAGTTVTMADDKELAVSRRRLPDLVALTSTRL